MKIIPMLERRTFRWAAWLGWQLDSNWTEPWLFAIYVLIKPLTASLMLVCMYFAASKASGGAVPVEFLPYLYISSACYGLVGAVMFGMSSAVLSDREHYRMLKYIYIAPADLRTYFVGRALSGGVQSLLGGLINLTAGAVMFSEVRHPLLRGPEWGWLIPYLLVGTILLAALGLILSAAVLNMPRQGMYLSEGVAGLMYLLCGVVFPLSVLPGWARAVGLMLPPTYWLEGMRRTLLGPPTLPTPLADWSQGELLIALLLSTTVLVGFAVVFFNWSERRAWRHGRFEESTGA